MDMLDAAEQRLTVTLELAPDVYTALARRAQHIGITLMALCQSICCTALEQYGQAAFVTSTEPTSVVAAHIDAVGTEFVAEFELSPALYRAVWGRAQERHATRRKHSLQLELANLCHDICFTALLEHAALADDQPSTGS